MLNTQKLLYILPDVAYVAELLPTKKEHTFSIHSFRQINGEFMTADDDFIAENIEKLFTKLEPETYHVILPDFLFTNTILEVKETHELKIKSYLKDELLPSLDLSKDSHQIETFILTQYNGASKIQLTAIEKTVLDPIVQSSTAHQVNISNISPLTWTLKSMISLEPSISVIQIGSMLYVAEHYIGVDQCTMAAVADLADVGDTIKTLKGSQPSIQTIYLMTNDLVEDGLKALVSDTLPVQQLASGESTDEQLPNYVKNIIEAGMKTLDITDYPVPRFASPKSSGATTSAGTQHDDTQDEKASEDSPKEQPEPEAQSKKPAHDSLFIDDLADDDSEVEDDALPPLTPPAAPPTLPFASASSSVTESMASTTAHITSLSLDDELEEEEILSPNSPASDQSSVMHIHQELEEVTLPSDTPSGEPTRDKEIVDHMTENQPIEPVVFRHTTLDVSAPAAEPIKKVIKNSNATSNARMLLLMLGVFIATVLAGVAIGFTVLKITDQTTTANPTTSPTPSPMAVTSPSPSPSPSPTPSASIREGKHILVVNATTKAGYAGTIKTKLESAGFTGVKSANAKGDYTAGDMVLMKTDDPALVSILSQDSGLDLTFSDKIATEDTAGIYDAVVVLVE